MSSFMKNEGGQKQKTTNKNTSYTSPNPYQQYSSFFNQFNPQKQSLDLNAMIPKLNNGNQAENVYRMLAEQQ